MDHCRVAYARREDHRRDLEIRIERAGPYVLAYGARRSLEGEARARVLG